MPGIITLEWNTCYDRLMLAVGRIARLSFFSRLSYRYAISTEIGPSSGVTLSIGAKFKSYTIQFPILQRRFARSFTVILSPTFSPIQAYDLVEVEYDDEKEMGSNGDAKVLSGRVVSKEIQEKLAEEVKTIQEKHPEFSPTLAIVQVGGREDSNVYIRMKSKAASQVGVTVQHIKFPRTITEEELISELHKLNNDDSIHGVIVQLPLDCDNPIDANLITNTVAPSKDVDGIHDENAGKLAHGQLEGFFIACTPYGCLELIKKSGVEIKGSRAVVLGRSKIVGTPMAQLLLWNHATVTICHSRTKDLPSVVREADILVVAIGRGQMVKGDWIKPGAVVIDCGINSIPDPSKASGSRLVGDVDYEEAKKVASYITPVPGGVGPMTVAILMKNTVDAGKRCLEKKLGKKL